MASFLDYLKGLADPDSQTQSSIVLAPGAQTTMGNGTATDAPPVDAPARAVPVAQYDPSTAPPPANPTLDPTTQAQADAGIPVTARTHPAAQGVSFQLPKVAADVADDPNRTPGDDEPANYTPEEMASSKTPKDDHGNPIVHKGAFGQTGTLRNILGTLGDALLIQGGAKPMYAPKREQEKESDALIGFAANPSAAIGRVASVDPKAAIGLQNQIANQDLSQGRINQASQKLGVTQGAQQAKVLSGLAYSYAAAKTPQAKAQAQAQYQAYRDRVNADPNQFPDISDDNASQLANAYIPRVAQQQQQVDQTGQHLVNADTVAKQNAGSNAIRASAAMKNANKPSAASRPVNPTAASIAAPILAQMAKGVAPSPQQQQILQATGFSPDNAPKGAKGSKGLSFPSAAKATGLSTNPPAFKANGWLYDAQGKPVRKAP